MKMDPLAQACLLNASARHSDVLRRAQKQKRYAQAKAVKERTKDATRTLPWNRLAVPMKLYLCDSVREQLQKAIQADCDREWRERGNKD